MFIQTERLEIKPITLEDRGPMLDLFTDELVGRTYMLPQYTSREEAEPLFQRLVALSHAPNRYVSGIYLQDRLIGIVNDTEIEGTQIEMGYALLPAYHNQGFATEMLKGAIEYLFACGFDKVVCGAFSENLASIRVMEKCGMAKQPGTENIEYRGKVHCCVFYAIDKSDE